MMSRRARTIIGAVVCILVAVIAVIVVVLGRSE